jgi:hypothetical protein
LTTCRRISSSGNCDWSFLALGSGLASVTLTLLGFRR